MNKYDLTVLICSFNPEYEKLIMTIRSCLLQKDITLQIVIADDGSVIDYFDEVEAIFENAKFTDYKLIKNKENLGIVLNLYSGLMECNGEYIKPISPGDYLYNETTMHDWLQYMKLGNYVLTGSDYVCHYTDKNGEFCIAAQKAHPQIIGLNRKRLKDNYLLNDDIFLGAATLVKKETLLQYINLIKGRVKYAEDNSYRIMVYCDEAVGFYACPTVLYEIGTGISTSGDSEWHKLIQADWTATNTIIKELHTQDEVFRNKFLKVARKREVMGKGLLKKIIFYLSIRGLILLKVKTKIIPRFTSLKVSGNWLNKLKEWSEGERTTDGSCS